MSEIDFFDLLAISFGAESSFSNRCRQNGRRGLRELEIIIVNLNSVAAENQHPAPLAEKILQFLHEGIRNSGDVAKHNDLVRVQRSGGEAIRKNDSRKVKRGIPIAGRVQRPRE